MYGGPFFTASSGYPVHTAISSSRFTLAKIRFTANELDRKDSDGNTPLHLAVRMQSLEMVEFLISKGCNVNISNNSGDTPLHFAYAKASKEIIEVLIKNKAETNKKNKAGKTPPEVVEVCESKSSKETSAKVTLDSKRQ